MSTPRLPPSPPHASDRSDAAPAGKRAAVLVVVPDDEERRCACAALEAAGFEAGGVRDPRQARAWLDRTRVDALVLDLAGAPLPAAELVEEVRARPEGAGVAVVALLAASDRATLQASLDAGVDDFAPHPVAWEALAARVALRLRRCSERVVLRTERDRLARVQRAVAAGAWSYSPADDCFAFTREACAAIEGLPGGELTLAALLDCVVVEDREAVRAWLEAEHDPPQASELELRLRRAGEGVRFLWARREPGRPGEPVVGEVVDRTPLRRAEEQIRFLAYCDGLTQLPNRVGFREHLADAIGRARREEHEVGVVSIDLDGFRRVNDRCGHAVGDRLLGEIADRLRATARAVEGPSDAPEPYVARLGGDEFAYVVEGPAPLPVCEAIAERLTSELPAPVMVGPHELTVTASAGIARWPIDGSDTDALLCAADSALHAARRRGHGHWAAYSGVRDAGLHRRVELEAKLRRALDLGQLGVHFQPLARAEDGAIVGAEALGRWTPPGEGPVGPDVFVPLAEEIGLIDRLGQWVLEAACQHAALWRAHGLDLVVAVNLSAHQIDAALPALVERTLADNALPASSLVLEITESVELRDERTVIPVLQAIRALGVGLALDDFGTGYSSLSFLQRYPLDRLKIDRSFVGALETRPEDQVLVRAVLQMAHALGLAVVAEGVETPWQRDFLRDLGCDVLQGYLVGRPLPPEELEDWLLSRGPGAAPGRHPSPLSRCSRARGAPRASRGRPR